MATGEKRNACPAQPHLDLRVGETRDHAFHEQDLSQKRPKKDAKKTEKWDTGKKNALGKQTLFTYELSALRVKTSKGSIIFPRKHSVLVLLE